MVVAICGHDSTMTRNLASGLYPLAAYGLAYRNGPFASLKEAALDQPLVQVEPVPILNANPEVRGLVEGSRSLERSA